jgi:hypothetical protein
MPRSSRLLALVATVLLSLGAAACNGGEADVRTENPVDTGADTGATGEGFEDVEEPEGGTGEPGAPAGGVDDGEVGEDDAEG